MDVSRQGPDETFETSEAGPAYEYGSARRRRLAVPLLAFMGISLSVVITYFAWSGLLAEKHAEIRTRIGDLVGRIETEINMPLSSMRALRAFLDTTPKVSPESFAAFAKGLHSHEIGTIGYGYATRVDAASPLSSETQPYSFVVRMFEPLDAMRSLLGTDISRFPGVKDELFASINFDEVWLTAPLVKDSTLFGFYPHFKAGTPSYLVSQRVANVEGIIFAVHDIESIIDFAVRNSSMNDLVLNETVGLRVARVGADGESPPIFMTNNFDGLAKSAEASLSGLAQMHTVEFIASNMPLRIMTVTNLTALPEQTYALAGGILLIGLILTATLSAFAYMLLTREESIKALVDERTLALQKSQKLFEDMANVSADWFWETDAQHKFTFLSEKFEAVNGLNPMQFLGRTRLEAVGVNMHDAPDKWREHAEMLDNHLGFQDFRYTMPRSSAGDSHLSISGKPIFDADGVFTGYRGSGRDVTIEETAKRRLQESEERLYRYVEELEVSRQYLEENTEQMAELAESYAAEKERAEASERSKSEFLASMSHEIRTPMTGVMGFADMLLDGNLGADEREKVIKIKGATQSLLTIINDILDLSKLDVGKIDIENLDFNFPYAIEEAIDLVRERARQKGLYVLADTDAVPVGVNGDPTRIRQVLINLIGNAVKFTHQGGITVRAEVTENQGQKMILIRIIDTGIGISEENQRQLFRDFSQADASISRRYEGTGLGLAISKRLVELMGGEIGVSSRLEQGSEFWFQIPLHMATTDVTTIPRLPPVQNFVATRALNILIAEDNHLNQRIILATVEKYGHQATVVQDGEEAVEEAAKNPYDLLLCDVRMPNVSGPDATRAIRAAKGQEAQMPIIALTADAMEEHVREYFAAGMNACVTKPIDRQELLMAINDVMGEEIHIADTASEKDEIQTGNAPSNDVDDQETVRIKNFLQNLQAVADEIERTRETEK